MNTNQEPSPALAVTPRSALDARIGSWLRQAKIKDTVGDQFWKEGNLEQALRFKTESLILNRCAREIRETLSSPNVKDEPRRSEA